MNAPIKSRPVFIAALPREIAVLVSQPGWRRHKPQQGIHLYEHVNAVVACAGMGAHRATLAIQAALALGPASEMISIGWAGAANPAITVGEILRPNIVIDAKTGERFFSTDTEHSARGASVLVTVPVPAGTQEKARLSLSYYALAVDMEAAAVARIARARELPFRAIKAISDAADFALPDISRYTRADGHLHEAAFGLHVALHPSLWRAVTTLARGSKLAAARLCAEIASDLAQKT
jgi:adenosylhomocysteine nucleosidase